VRVNDQQSDLGKKEKNWLYVRYHIFFLDVKLDTIVNQNDFITHMVCLVFHSFFSLIFHIFLLGS